MDVKDRGETKERGSNGSSKNGTDTLDKITDRTKNLFEDLTSWFELKVQYIILDYQEQITKKAKNIAYEAVAMTILAIAGLFALISLALGLGVLLTHPAWGFLAVTVLLVLIAFIVRMIGKRFTKSDEIPSKSHSVRIKEAQRQLPDRSTPNSLPEVDGKDKIPG